MAAIPTNVWISLCLISLTYVSSGCRSKGSSLRPDRFDQGSIVAGVEGVSEDALKLSPSFLLICEGKDKKASSAATDEKVIFNDATEIVPGDFCALEVRLPEPDKVAAVKNWQWYGYKGQTKDVGLLYGSNLAKVGPDRELKLELYKLFAEPSGNLGVSGTPEGPCLKYEKPKCLDRRSVFLDVSARVVMRILAAKEGDKNPTVFVVTAAGPSATTLGIGVMPQGEMTADALTKAFATPDTAALKIRAFKEFDVSEKILKKPFTQEVVEGKSFADQSVDPADLKDYKVLDIAQVWVHGWDKLADSHELDKLADPRWLAKVTATKDNQTVSFLVGGAKPYFQSTTKAISKRNGQSYAVYYAWPEVAGDVEDGASDQWQIYALSDSSMVPTGCEKAPLNYYLSEIGALTEVEISGKTPISAIDACQIKGALWRAELKTWSVKADFYTWRWAAPR
jgi:hypothetical protein